MGKKPNTNSNKSTQQRNDVNNRADLPETQKKRLDMKEFYRKGNNNTESKETFHIISKSYKKRQCEFYKKGACKKGNDCTYSHDFEVKVIEKVCKFFMSNSCYKENCLFSHDLSLYPCKFLHVGGKCDNLTECKFSHEIFKTKESIIEFIQDNSTSIKKHLANSITTP